MITNKKGFTLLELLIVIAIIAILSVVLIVALNPAETLKKTRDSQRISDLSSVKTALGIYVTSVASPDLDASVANFCLTGTEATGQIAYSVGAGATACATVVVAGTDTGATFSATDNCYNVAAGSESLVNGSGWLPVDLTQIAGGSPISNLPVDPISDTMTTTPSNAKKYYRYVCQDASPASGKPATVFEINAILESAAFGPGGTDDKSKKDGGDNDNYYEVGTSVRLLGTGTNF